MSAHDRYLTGHRTEQVSLRCEDCGERGDGRVTTEYGMSWTEPEECPRCYGGLTIDGEPDGPDPDAARDRMMEEAA